MRILVAVLVSVLLAQWLELWYRTGAEWTPGVLVGSGLVYLLMMVPFHIAVSLLPRAPERMWLVIGCVPGMALEWFVIGNSPWGNPDALQSGMFVFHGTYPIWGRMFDPAFFGPRRRRAALIALAVFSVVSAGGYLIPDGMARFGFFLFVPLGLYLVLAVMTLTGRPRG